VAVSDPQPLIASAAALPNSTPAPTPAPLADPSVSDLPSAPTAPVITKTTAGNNSVRITWTVPSSSGDSDISGYNVYVGTTAGGESSRPVNGSALIAGTSYVVPDLAVGPTYYFTVKAVASNTGISPTSNQKSAVPTGSFHTVGSLSGQIVGLASNPSGNGYWLANAVGDVSSHGGATDYGSIDGGPLNAPIDAIVATSDGKGYWLVATDGGVFSFGDAQFYGSMGGIPLNAPVVGLTPTPDGNGYWEVASDGGVFSFGSAVYHGSAGTMTLNAPIAGISPDQAGGGYWLVGWDGGVFAYGTPFHGAG
jgi:hypothetical protein